jgi:hypothetical protein
MYLGDPGGHLGAIPCAEPSEDVADVVADRARRQYQSLRNLLVAHPLRDQPRDLQLAAGQRRAVGGGG